MLNLSPQGVLFLRLVKIIYEKIEKKWLVRTYVLYTSKKRVKNGLHLRVTYKRCHKTLITQKVTVYILICMERGRKSNPQICYSFFAYINSKNVI